MAIALQRGSFKLSRASSAERAEFRDIILDWGLSLVTPSTLEFNRSGLAISSAEAPIARNASVEDIFQIGFRLDDVDQVSEWFPQGMSGSGDAYDSGLYDGSDRFLLVSSYDRNPILGFCDVDRGARVTFAKITAFPTVEYRHVLLVKPVRDEAGTATFEIAAPQLHAGGCVWYENLLYVTNGNEILVFDVDEMRDLGVEGDEDACPASEDEIGFDGGTVQAFGFRYILPMVDRYEIDAAASTVDADQLDDHFHVLGLDRTSSPHRLVSAKYVVANWFQALLSGYDDDLNHSLIAFWDLEPDGTLTEASTDAVEAAQVGLMGEPHVQGVLAQGNSVWLCKGGWTGELGFRQAVEEPASGYFEGDLTDWVNYGEGLMFEPSTNFLWNVNEAKDGRACFAVNLDDTTSMVRYVPPAGPGVEMPFEFLLIRDLLARWAFPIHERGNFWGFVDPYVRVLDNPPFPPWPNEEIFYRSTDLTLDSFVQSYAVGSFSREWVEREEWTTTIMDARQEATLFRNYFLR